MPRESAEAARGSLWKTPEFIGYFGLVVAIHIYIIPILLEISSDKNPNWRLFEGRLSEGWLFGRKMDLSDGQYGNFRRNMGLLSLGAVAHLFISWLVRSFRPFPTDQKPGFNLWILTHLILSCVFLWVIHGTGLLKIITILSVNYLIAKLGGEWRGTPFLTWAFGIAILFLNDIYSGYEFAWISPSLSFLDAKGGLMRWYVNFNMSLLRMLSFSMDYYWSFGKNTPEKSSDVDDEDRPNKEAIPLTRNNRQPTRHQPPTDRERAETSHHPTDYNFITYLCYCLYMPLYLAGPIITFNSFLSQVRNPPASVTRKSVLTYGLRLVGVLLLMEIMLHTIYVQAMSKVGAWRGFDPVRIVLYSVYNLTFVWLKLLVIWRFFRFWAMADGINTVENMTRCMYNSYSTLEFWRSWHRSYNRWIIRYMYIPLGGAATRVWNIWPVFTFVAIWHDIQLRLLLWGWLICLFMLPEILMGWVNGKFIRPRVLALYPADERHNPGDGHESNGQRALRWIAAFGYALNIIMMVLANTVGFCVRSTEDAIDIFTIIFSNPFFNLVWPVLTFIVAQIAVEIRYNEQQARLKRP